MGISSFIHNHFLSRSVSLGSGARCVFFFRAFLMQCQDVLRKIVHQHKMEIHTLKDKEAAKAEEINKMKKEETLGPLI